MLIPKASPPSYAVSRWIFARALGVIFFSAFGSLALQVRGLIGARGIVPAQEFLHAAQAQLGAAAYWKVPTLCWLSAGDGFLVTLCIAGVILSILLAWGYRPGLCAFLLWGLYLSITSVSSPFLDFQWDGLLLETGFLAIFLFPFRRPNWRRMTVLSRASHWLLWWLLFRLMFESGVVKLASGDSTWRNFSALNFHFETQPLPIWTSWFANQSPHWILHLAVRIMFAIELLAPWMIVAPARFRHIAAWAMIGLQVIIFATGNYAFFNLLTIALCILLFEDSAWPKRFREEIQLGVIFNARIPTWARFIAIPTASCVAVLTAMPLFYTLGWFRNSSGWVVSTQSAVAPLRSFNGYGLFAVMTTSRHEIVIEGTDDGVIWQEYEFPWKPGDLNERPGLCAPYQPRLDWQMWFAALGTPEQNPWLLRLLQRLLEGSPEAIGLLRRNPFSDHPPRAIRALVYDYHFTRSGDSGPAWWKRELLGLYYPPVSLKSPGQSPH